MSIALAKNYVALLDEVYKKAAITSILDSDASMAREGANAHEILIPKLSMDGLADYSRNSGYTKGDVNLEWETVAFNYDRGRKFEVDTMDDEETINTAFGKLAGEFIRTKVAPEGDAFTFATIAQASGISSASGTLSSGSDVLAALITATNALDEDEVPEEDRVLFITPTLLNSIKALDTTKSREILESFAEIKKVPQSRFYSKITLKDGTTAGQTAGGYAKAGDGKDINFLIVHKPAVLKFNKHIASNIITPDENQDSDAYIQKYRKYGLVDVYENKVAGVYLHVKP